VSVPLFSKLLVAVTGSQASIDAAKCAIVMAKQYDCSLAATYVVDTATIRQLAMSKIFVSDESEEFEDSLQANGERYLDYVEELAEKRGVQIDKFLRKGAVCTEILTLARELDIDLILLGGWENDRNPRDIISQSHREVLVNSTCSVYIVKEPDIDQLYNQA